MTPDSVMPGGTLLGNRYRLMAPLGTGGFATVYLAQDTNLYNNEVVIKTLLECRQSSNWADKKFKQECEALARIDHPGVVQVLDRVAGSEVCDDTASRVAGTLTYMAPEHLDGRPETASDIYALGVVAFEMVTGSVPFKARSQVDLYRQQAQGPPHPCKLRPDLPAAAGAVILKALAFRAAERYARAADFGAEFDAAISEPPAPQHSPGIPWRLMAMIEAGLFLALLTVFLLRR